MGLDDVRAIRSLLARAYDDDPLMRWIFPVDATRRDAVAAWLGLFVEGYAASGTVEVLRGGRAGADALSGAGSGPGDAAAEVSAVAIWRLPGAAASPPSLPTIGGLLAALAGPERATSIGAALAATRALAPSEPHAYLHFLAVDPALQGRGLGGAVIGPGLDRAADAGLGVHLETTNPAAVRFYQHLGFAVTAEVRLADGGPPLWAMGRATPA